MNYWIRARMDMRLGQRRLRSRGGIEGLMTAPLELGRVEPESYGYCPDSTKTCIGVGSRWWRCFYV